MKKYKDLVKKKTGLEELDKIFAPKIEENPDSIPLTPEQQKEQDRINAEWAKWQEQWEENPSIRNTELKEDKITKR